MKIIDLLNKIANGEEVPKKIEYRNIKFLYNETNKHYIVENCDEYNDLLMEISNHKGTDLNYEVEILEEEKKIPEKLDNFTISVGRVDDSNIEEYIHRLFEQQYEMFNKINSIIDYLKSKGE